MRIIYSEDYGLIRLKLNSLTEKMDEKDIFKLSFSENNWNQIRAALTNINFQAHQQKKLIILEDAVFLSKTKVKLESNFKPELFWRILENLEPDLDLILTVISNKLLNNWPKSIKPLVNYLAAWDKNELSVHLTKHLKPKLEKEALAYFTKTFLKSGISQINNEIDKINNLYEAKKIISLQELKSILVPPLYMDVFRISSSFLEGDINKFLQLWHQGLDEELNIQQLFGLIVKQLIDLRWYFKYHQLGFQDWEIANFLKINPYYLKKLLTTNSQQVSEINDRIRDIYSLNKKILLGKIDKKIIPEYLFLKMFPQLSEREKNGTNQSL